MPRARDGCRRERAELALTRRRRWLVRRPHRSIGLPQLEADLRRAGLRLPPRIEVLLLPDDDPRARAIPPWIVGLAAGAQDVVILPQRVLPYPYDSVESVFRHEVAHLALSAAAGGRPLPRWFHEGVAMSVDTGWDLSGRVRLLFEMTKGPATADLARLFAAGTQSEAALAYGCPPRWSPTWHGAMAPRRWTNCGARRRACPLP